MTNEVFDGVNNENELNSVRSVRYDPPSPMKRSALKWRIWKSLPLTRVDYLEIGKMLIAGTNQWYSCSLLYWRLWFLCCNAVARRNIEFLVYFYLLRHVRSCCLHFHSAFESTYCYAILC